jgi:hypothetical protein
MINRGFFKVGKIYRWVYGHNHLLFFVLLKQRSAKELIVLKTNGSKDIFICSNTDTEKDFVELG